MLRDETTDHNLKLPDADDTLMAKEEEPLFPALGEGASLVVLSGWEIGHEIEMHVFPHRLGRSPDAQTCIGAASVSRHHAEILYEEHDGEGCYYIQDLNSSNGTCVNNQRVTRACLHQGDHIRMGEVLLKFVLRDSVESAFHQRVHRLIHYDQLTGLLTMEAFRNRAEFVLRSSTEKQPFCLAMTDLDGLKGVNDTYGHLAGRMTVCEMGGMIRQCLRKQDFAGLYGGDESILLFPDTALPQVYALLELLRTTIEARVLTYNGHSFGVTISQGVAQWPQHGETLDALIAAADKALYAAKLAGRNRVCSFPDIE